MTPAVVWDTLRSTINGMASTAPAVARVLQLTSSSIPNRASCEKTGPRSGSERVRSGILLKLLQRPRRSGRPRRTSWRAALARRYVRQLEPSEQRGPQIARSAGQLAGEPAVRWNVPSGAATDLWFRPLSLKKLRRDNAGAGSGSSRLRWQSLRSWRSPSGRSGPEPHP